MATESCKVLPSSKQTSNQNSDRLDFDSGAGGKSKEDAKSDAESELEDGEILSESDANDEDIKQSDTVKGNEPQTEKSSSAVSNSEKLSKNTYVKERKNKYAERGSDNLDALSKYEKRYADSDSRRHNRRPDTHRERKSGDSYHKRSQSKDREHSVKEDRKSERKPAWKKPREMVEPRPSLPKKIEITDKSGPDNMLSLDLIQKARSQGVKTVHVPIAPRMGKSENKEQEDEQRKKEDITKKLGIETTLKSFIQESKLQKNKGKQDSVAEKGRAEEDVQKSDALQRNYTEDLKMKVWRHKQKNRIKPEFEIVEAKNLHVASNNSTDAQQSQSNTTVSQKKSVTKDVPQKETRALLSEKTEGESDAKKQAEIPKASKCPVAAKSGTLDKVISNQAGVLKQAEDDNDVDDENPPPLPDESISVPPEELPEGELVIMMEEGNRNKTDRQKELDTTTEKVDVSATEEMKSTGDLSREKFGELLYFGDDSDVGSEDVGYSASDKEEYDLYSMIFTGDSAADNTVSEEGNSSNVFGDGTMATDSDLDRTLIEEESMTSSPPQKRKRSRSGDDSLKENQEEEYTESEVPPQKKQCKSADKEENDQAAADEDVEVSGNAEEEGEVDNNEAEGDEETSMGQTRELDIIDDIQGDDREDYELEDGEISDDEMLDDSELHAMLEEGVDKHAQDNDEDEPVYRDKIVLDEKGVDPFELLPEGWVVVTHNCGMPVYLHKTSRVCTMAKPYFLGPGSVRKHDIPLSAIPCLHYGKALKQEKEVETANTEGQVNGQDTGAVNSENKDNGDQSQSERSGLQVMDESGKLVPLPVKVECAEESQKQKSLSADEVRNYCEELFLFKTITVKKFKSWKTRRKHLLKQRHHKPRPTLPSSAKLIKCTVPQESSHGEEKRSKKKEFVLNPMGKSFVCVLHEYAQHTLKLQPKYLFRELENAQTPYSATVLINDIMYGTGYASSKKSAKMEAAKNTLSILIPEMTKVMEENANEQEDLTFFDTIKIEDPRVYDLCNKAGQHSPYQILLECLKRNFGMGDTNCRVDVKPLKHQKSEYSLSVGKHSVSVVCKNKREGKQRAAQAMLQTLHPHIYSLGALLRLYGKSSWKSVKEKKKEEHQITELQSQAKASRPNTALLDKLKEEMNKLMEQRKAIPSKGKFVIDTASLARESIKTIDL